MGKSRPGIVYFSTEPETFRPISDVSTVHLVHFYPERDESRKISSTYRSFFNGNGKKIVNFWPWTVLPGKIRSHSDQVRWRLTEQIPFSYRHFWKMSRWNSVKDILERDRWDLIYKCESVGVCVFVCVSRNPHQVIGGVRVALKRVWRGSTASTVGPVPHGDS